MSEPRIIVAAYNERANLAGVCARIRAALGTAARYSVLIVDDGSRDGTAEEAARLAREHPIRCVTHPVNRGIAAVFLTGIRSALESSAEETPIVIMEGDGTSDPAILPSLLEQLRENDVVIASRYAPGGAYRNFPLKRWVLSHAANWLLRLVCRLPGVRDYTIFYRAYRAGPLARALDAHGDSFTSVGGFACNAEMLLRLSRTVQRIAEVPLVYDYGIKRGKSGMRIPNNLVSYAKLFRIFFTG